MRISTPTSGDDDHQADVCQASSQLLTLKRIGVPQALDDVLLKRSSKLAEHDKKLDKTKRNLEVRFPAWRACLLVEH